jgi:DNA polymerase-3 subunit delta
MKISNYHIDGYIQKISGEKIAGCLIFGREESLANYRFDIIARKISPNLSDPFLVVNLSKGRLHLEPSIIADEFFSFSMLGGRKLILIKYPEAASIKALKDLMEDDKITKSDNFILILAGDLDKSSSLRKVSEDAKCIAAIPCYEDDDGVIKKFIQSELAKNKINFDSEIIDFLYEKLGKNRQIILSEIEKIATFLYGGKKLEIADLAYLIGSMAEISATKAVESFFLKEYEASLRQINKMFDDGFEAITLIRFFLNYAQKLYSAKMAIELENTDFEVAIKMQRLFFKMEVQFRKNLKSTSLDFLTDFLRKIFMLEQQAKMNHQIAKGLIIKALFIN